MIAKMRNMGEACTAANRFYVHEKVHDEFAKKLTAKMAGLKMGNGLDDGVALGPLVNKDGRDKVIELVDDAVKKGAKVLTGGKTSDGPGFFYPATVLTNVSDDAKMLNEEIFGPVASIQTFKSEDEVITRANDTEYGLVAYLYTKDMSRGMRVSEQARLRHDRLESRPRLRSRRAVRRHQAERPRPRRRTRRHDGIHGITIHLGDVVNEQTQTRAPAPDRLLALHRLERRRQAAPGARPQSQGHHHLRCPRPHGVPRRARSRDDAGRQGADAATRRRRRSPTTSPISAPIRSTSRRARSRITARAACSRATRATSCAATNSSATGSSCAPSARMHEVIWERIK